MTEEPTPEQIEAALNGHRAEVLHQEGSTYAGGRPLDEWPTRNVEAMRAALVAAAGAAPQEPGVVCAWCPGHARGSAWHSDGSLHPSCGQIEHGGGWVPSWPGSVIDEVGLSNVLMQVYDNGSQPNALPEARAIIAKVDEWLRGGAR